MIALLLTTERILVEQVGAVIESSPIVAAFATNRRRGGARPRGTGRGGAPSGCGNFSNPRGGVARGSFFNLHSNPPVGEAFSSSMPPRMVCQI
ncbi:hypothetical protein ACE6H2_014703 [Prunus campanulata]